MGFHTQLPGVQQIVRYPSEINDSLGGKFTRLGAEVGEPINRVQRLRLVAAAIVVEAAGKGRVALCACSNRRLRWHGINRLRLRNPGLDFGSPGECFLRKVVFFQESTVVSITRIGPRAVDMRQCNAVQAHARRTRHKCLYRHVVSVVVLDAG